MKRMIYKALAIASLWSALGSCSNNEEIYDTPDCHLNFLYYSEYIEGEVPADRLEWEFGENYYKYSYSFVYAGDVQRDTVWFEVGTMGFLADEARPIALEQVMSDTAENAVAGRHYVAFDDPELAPLYQVSAHANKMRVPVVVLREDAGLKQKTVHLHFRFKDNGYFSAGYDGLDFRVIEITDRLAKPSNWDERMMDMFIGPYGEKMHELMIEWTDDPWDEAFIEEYYATDNSYKVYMLEWFNRKLAEENEIRLANPAIGDIYREADGRPVAFVHM